MVYCTRWYCTLLLTVGILGTVVGFPLPFIEAIQEVTLKGRSRMSKYVGSPLEVQGCSGDLLVFYRFSSFLFWLFQGV